MRDLWRDFPDACDNTLAIAERVHVEFAEGANLMPQFPVPAGESEESWLVKEVEIGLRNRFPTGVPDTHRRQAEYELGVIGQMGFPGYFLVVADLVRYAQANAIRVGPGRGSAAGSMVSYALGITQLDPIHHKLLFERFLNPERVSMPDIDMDFDERRRGDMIRYATETYGEERVAQIITYGTIKAKQAVKDSARVLGFPFSTSDQITKVMPPPVMGKDVSLAGIFDTDHARYGEAAEFRALYEANPDVKKVVDTARNLEGLKRQWGVHAAGVILSREPLLDVIPIQRREQDGAIITQFDMGACEALGLLKMDFLGLRNLTVLDDCLASIKDNRGDEVVLEQLDLDADSNTYELLGRGDTLGIFQLEGSGMRSLLRLMQPTSFADISAVGALYRPGPMGANAHTDYAERKNGRRPVTAIHPELAEPLREILDETYGVIVYQEQVMAIAQKLAGYSPGTSRPVAPSDGQEEERNPRQGIRSVLPRHAGQRLLQRCGQDDLGHPRSVLRLRIQQGAQRGVWRCLVLDRVPEGELPGRVHGGAADQREGRQRQVRALSARMPAHGHQGVATRRQRIRLQLHPARHRHPVRAVGDPQRGRERGRVDHRDPARQRAGSRISPISWPR